MTMTKEDAAELAGWWSIVLVGGDKTLSPVVFDQPSGLKVRAYREGQWDDRFMPRQICRGIDELRGRMDEWARLARKKSEGPVLIGVPAAVAVLMFGHPAAKCERS